MARDSQAALVALNRFGFGARGGASGDFVNAASDPRGFVKAELSRPNGALLEVPGLLSTPALGRRCSTISSRSSRRAMLPRSRGAAAPEAAAAGGRPKAQRRNLSLSSIAMEMAGRRSRRCRPPDSGSARRRCRPAEAMQPNAPKPPPQPLNIIQKTFRAEALARLQRAIMADCGFVERLVVFWSNHFCISASKGGLARMWAGSFEREAIRPHVLGRFGDMLKAVEQHPAMLFFLDNQQSLGPDSRAGINRKRGLNENLAREIMELHTLGVDGGYSQDDVTSLARIITGWTYAGRQGQLGTPGSFVFNANAHQPGAQRLLGKIYENNGVAQGEAALADIARHPSTAKFIATKFARHFVADDPPPALVARLQEVFRKSDGDLKALATALLDSDEAWAAPHDQAAQPLRISGGDRPAAGADSGRSRPLSRRPQRAGPAAVVAGRAEWICRHQRGLGGTRGHQAAARHLGAAGLAPGRQHRSPRSAGTGRCRCGIAGNTAHHRARRIAAAGAGAAVDVAGIPEEMTPMETTMDCCESDGSQGIASSATSRRGLLLGGASFAAWAYLPKFARAADGRDPRLIVVILRGALDGLATVAPLGDPDYAGLHGSIALSSSGPNAALMLDSFFALHPAMPEFARMYREKHAAVVHAVATPYRDRSHFDGQDVLESGFAGPGRVQSGWLNRALEALPRGERVMSGLAIGPTTPLVLRGAAPTVGWAPVAMPQAADDTAARLIELYRHRDPALGSALVAGPASSTRPRKATT